MTFRYIHDNLFAWKQTVSKELADGWIEVQYCSLFWRPESSSLYISECESGYKYVSVGAPVVQVVEPVGWSFKLKNWCIVACGGTCRVEF